MQTGFSKYNAGELIKYSGCKLFFRFFSRIFRAGGGSRDAKIVTHKKSTYLFFFITVVINFQKF